MNLWMAVTPAAKTAIAVILLPAGGAKLVDRRDFVDVVRGFAILPEAVVPAFATAIPVAELVIGLALLGGALFGGFANEWFGLAAMALFVMFGTAIAINLIRGRSNISCGCFGSSSRKLTWGLVLRALFCTAICILALPMFHPGSPNAGLKDRAGAALIGAAIVAMIWLVNFIMTAGFDAFESQLS